MNDYTEMQQEIATPSYPNAAKGLKLMYTAIIILLFSPIVELIASLTSSFLYSLEYYNYISMAYTLIPDLIIVIAMSITLVGVLKLSKDSRDVKTAIYLVIADIVISIVAAALQAANIGLYNASDFVSGVLQLVALYYILKGIKALCANVGATKVAKYAKKTWIVNIVSTVLLFLSMVSAIVFAVLDDFFYLIISGYVALVAIIMNIAATIMYIVLLKKSYKALGK